MINSTRKSTLSIIILFLLAFAASYAQTRGVGVRVKNDSGKTEEIKLYEGSYALVIGNGTYTNGWDNLAGVAADVAAVKRALERQGFTVETAQDLASRDMSSRIQKFVDDYGYQPNNRLLIYYAGHGHTLKSTGDGRDLGYIVPVDAPNPKKDEIGFKRRAIPMDDVQNFAKKIQAKHALFLFDSCFSGKLVTRNTIVVPPVIQENVAYPVRQFITAGAANQPVPDESVFRRSFIRALDGEADLNNDGYITGTELAEYLKDKVTNYSNRQQTPQYGKINDVELDRGDFVFVLPQTASASGIAAVSAGPTAPTTGADTGSIEKEFWEAIKNSTDAADFNLYKQKYPNGIYANLADLSLARLTRNEAKPSETKPTEPNASGAKPIGPKPSQPKHEPLPAAVQVLNQAIDVSNKNVAKKKYDPVWLMREYNRAIEIDPLYSRAYAYRAILYMTQNNREAGLADFSKAIELDPEDTFPYIYRADFNSVSDPDSAIADYNKAVEINPRSFDAYSHRSTHYYYRKEYEAAISDCGKMLEIEPQSPQVYEFRATVYEQMGQNELAKADRQKAKELSRN